MEQDSKKFEYILYCHTNLINDKKYFGITRQSPQRRWGKNGIAYKCNTHFYGAITKYGWDNFSHDILFSRLSIEDACELEQEHIAKFQTTNPLYGYNHTSGGDSNYSFSDDVKLKMREAAKHRVITDEWRRHLSESRTGRKPWNAGKTLSTETRRKISEAGIGRKHKPESILLMREASWNKRSVIVDGNVFSSMSLCAEYLGVKINRLNAWLGGKESFSKEYVDRGLSFNEVKHEYVVFESEKEYKRVFCDGMYFKSMLACDKYYNLPRCTVSGWLNGLVKMPQEFKDKGLRFDIQPRYKYKVTE